MTSDHRAFRDKQQLYDFSSDHTLGVKSSNTGDKVEKRHGARSGFDRASKL